MKILEYLDQYKASTAIHQAFEKSIFRALLRGRCDVGELADRLDVKDFEITTICNFLISIGVFQEEQKVIRISDDVEREIAKIGIDNLEKIALWSGFQLKKHAGALASISDYDKEHIWIDALHARSKSFELLPESLIDVLTKLSPESILEIGPGSGSLTRLLRQNFPSAEIHVVEQEHVVRQTKAYLEDVSNITYHEGNVLTFESCKKFDLVISNNVLHLFDADQLSSFARALASFKSQHSVVVFGGYFDRSEATSAALAHVMWVQNSVRFVGDRLRSKTFHDHGMRWMTSIDTDLAGFSYQVYE